MQSTASSEKIPLWVDCDTGHDDAYALLLAAYHPRAQLLGVSTVHGNAALKQTTFNTRAILEAIGRRDVKVYTGAAKPMYRDAVHAADIHGESGLDGVTLLPQPVEQAVEEEDCLEAMYKALIATPPNTAYLVSTGTLTNIGQLFLKYPDLAAHLKGLSIMGGAIGGGFTNAPMGKVEGEGERFGNWTAYAEFNIYCDPEASASILNNKVLNPKTTLVTLDLSHQVLATAPVRQQLLYSSAKTNSASGTTSALRALFWQILTFFAKTYAEVFSLTAGPPLHDPLAVAAILEPAFFPNPDGERFHVDVVTEGVHSMDQAKVGQLGRTVATKLPKGEAGVSIPRNVEVDKFWALIEECLQKADKVTPLPQLSPEDLRANGVSEESA
ncbi:Inosine/uridine-preferring nucleoside hydrolase [Delitschia confertaspora ATCC 74209]|uniref:Inosine/uridine-preferring nucleoside hydrolase n=1 Tax=Delitschia confertaspora ATCC 74209 TaxID=1513339 RepID=A0A9P4MR54_9PLEO|nr:Inosine/uridine-preferring nucleoside hydrolase [Delitschia confertaspora ATCC 74209]